MASIAATGSAGDLRRDVILRTILRTRKPLQFEDILSQNFFFVWLRASSG